MKRVIYLFACIFIFTIKSGAYDVTLNDQNTKVIVKTLDCCRIIVERGPSNAGNKYDINLSIENTQDDDLLCIFSKGYEERALKKQKPSIKFDKNYSGSKGHRIVKGCDVKKDTKISAGETKQILLAQIQEGEKTTIEIPIYTARYKNKKMTGIILYEELQETLDITVETTEKKEDDALPRLQASVDSLMALLDEHRNGNARFCTSPRHKPSAQEAETPFKEGIQELIRRIDQAIKDGNVNIKDEKGKVYYDLKSQLENIDFEAYEYICTKHSKTTPPLPSHQCQYCNLSLKDIYKRLETLYKKIDAFETTKRSSISEVNALYRCCTDSQCKTHAKEWKSNSDLRNKIEKYYNAIMDLEE